VTPSLALLLLAADPALIEQRYNSLRTLTLEFEQTYRAGGRERVETGTLALRKPGRMRWDYANGNVFVTDSKVIWFYQAAANRAEWSRAKESGDLRAPLAFLLGRLDFSKLFRETRQEAGELVAIPKSERAPYREVRFRAAADGRIEKVTVVSQDASVMEFLFRDERRDTSVDYARFRFAPPAGAQVVEVSAEP
jgi:outer membrane lipoprotein carrier protein